MSSPTVILPTFPIASAEDSSDPHVITIDAGQNLNKRGSVDAVHDSPRGNDTESQVTDESDGLPVLSDFDKFKMPDCSVSIFCSLHSSDKSEPSVVLLEGDAVEVLQR